MSYKVRVPDGVRELIESWGFSERFQLDLYQQMIGLLSERPAGDIGDRIVAPIRCFRTHVDLYCPDVGRDLCVALWVNDTEEPDTRIVIHAEYREM